MQSKRKIALRIDDIGASTKKYEAYGREYVKIFGKKIPVSLATNFLFLKYIPPFRKRGAYREMNVYEWGEIFRLLEKYCARLTVGITATWVEKNGSLIPFHKKYPNEAKVLKQGLNSGLLEIANHGLTHCVVGRHLPGLFSSNRKYHREFWDWIPEKLHYEHVKEAQEILQSYFNVNIVTLVPPGNVFSETTLRASKQHGIMFVNCNTTARQLEGMRIISDEEVIAFHDREIVLYGVKWLHSMLERYKEYDKVWVKDLMG